MAKTYWQKLQDPRWQKKRLEVLGDKDFTCEKCGNDRDTLHVHHKEYFSGRDPWDYSNDQLAVLCDYCHSNIHNSEDLMKVICSLMDYDGPNDRERIAFVVAGFMGFEYKNLFNDGERELDVWNDLHFKAGVKAKKAYESSLRRHIEKSGRGFK